MPLKYPDKGDEPLQSGNTRNFKDLKSNGIDYKRPLEFKAQIIPYEGNEDNDSPILAFSGNNVHFIFNIPREHFRKLATAVLDHMDNDLAKAEAPNSFCVSNASKNRSTSETTKECNFNLKDFDTDNTTEIFAAYKEECTCVSEDLPNVTQDESGTRVDPEIDGKENFSDESSSFDCKIGKSVKNDSSDTTNSRSTTTVPTADHDIPNHNSVAKKNHYSTHDVRLGEVKCSEDSTLEFRESLSIGKKKLECSETNDITEDIKAHEVNPDNGINIKMAPTENLVTDVQNESINLSSDKDFINERNDNIDIVDANLSAHTLDATFENCQDIERSWPDIHPFTEKEVIPLTEVKSCESVGVRMKYFKLKLLHELVVLKVTLEGNGLSVEAASYKTNINSVTKKSKDCSEGLKPFTNECREADKTVSIEQEKSMDKSESNIYKKSTDLSNREDQTKINDVEIVLQLEDKINNPNTNPGESAKKNTDMLEAIPNTESCVSQSKYSYKECEDQSTKQSENKINLESPSIKKVESLTENVDVPTVENFERYGTVKVHEIGQREENSSEDISTNEAEVDEISQNEVSTEDIEKIQSTEITDHQNELILENTKEETLSVNISSNEVGGDAIFEPAVSTEKIEKIQSTEIIDHQNELILENTKEETLSVNISSNEVGGDAIFEPAVSTEKIEKIQSTEIIDNQKELMLENTCSEKFSLEKLTILKDESLIISESEMDEKHVSKRSTASKMQLEESSAETYSSEDVSLNAVTLPIDSVEVSPIRRSRKYLDPKNNIKSPNKNTESAIISSEVEKEKPVYVIVSTPRNKPQQNDSGERGLQAANESNSEINSSSLKFTPDHRTIIKGSDSKGSVASPEAEIAASDQPGHLNVIDERGNIPELQAANVACYETENKTECSACDLNDTNYLDDTKNKSSQSLSDKNTGDISENKAIREIERDSKLIKLPAADAEEQVEDEKGFTNELTENLERGSVSKFISEEEKAEDISVESKLSKISLLESAEQVSDEDKELSFTNLLAANLKSGSVNETVKGDTSKNTSFIESEISEEIRTECMEEQSCEDGDDIENALTEDLKSESVQQTVLEEEENETVENISAECLEDIVEEVEKESLNASKDKDRFPENSSGNELETTVVVDNYDVKEEIEKTNGMKEKIISDTNDNAVNDSCTSESDSLTGSAPSVTLDDRASLETSCLKSFSDIDNTKDLGNVTPNKSFESETKSSDMVIEENGTAKSLDNVSEEYSQDSVSDKAASNESVEYRPQTFENSISDATVAKDIQDLDENKIESLSGEKTIEIDAESMSEVDILESDDSKSIASESDDSRDSGRSASKRKAKTYKYNYDETDCAPTRVRTRKAPSGLSEDVIPENSAVTGGAKSSEVRSLTTDRSLKPTGKVSPNARYLRSKSLDPSPQSSKVSTRDKKYGTVAETEEVGRRKRAATPEVIRKDIKAAVRSSPRKLTRANSANPEPSSSSSKVQSTRSGSADSQVKARPNLETSVSRRSKRGQ